MIRRHKNGVSQALAALALPGKQTSAYRSSPAQLSSAEEHDDSHERGKRSRRPVLGRDRVLLCLFFLAFSAIARCNVVYHAGTGTSTMRAQKVLEDSIVEFSNQIDVQKVSMVYTYY